MENMCILMGLPMKENGEMTSKMAKESKTGQMGLNTRESIEMAKSTGRDN